MRTLKDAAIGDTVTVYTYLSVREDAMELTLRGYELSLRRDDCELIEVEE